MNRTLGLGAIVCIGVACLAAWLLVRPASSGHSEGRQLALAPSIQAAADKHDLRSPEGEDGLSRSEPSDDLPLDQPPTVWSWAEGNVTLGGELFGEVDLQALDHEEMSAWRAQIRKMQAEYKRDLLSGLPANYPHIPSDPITSHYLIGTLDIYYMVSGEGNYRHVYVPPGGNEEIYSLRDAAQRLLESPAGQAAMDSIVANTKSRLEEFHPGVPFRVQVSEDGAHYTMWGDLGGGEVVIASASRSLID